MKANGLEAEYCQSCASLLDAHRANPQHVIVICGGCVGVFHQSGDYNRVMAQAVQLKPEPTKPPEEKPDEHVLKPKAVHKPSRGKK